MHVGDCIFDIVINFHKYVIDLLLGPHKYLERRVHIGHVDTNGAIVQCCNVVGPVAGHHWYSAINICSHTGRKDARLSLAEPCAGQCQQYSQCTTSTVQTQHAGYCNKNITGINKCNQHNILVSAAMWKLYLLHICKL